MSAAYQGGRMRSARLHIGALTAATITITALVLAGASLATAPMAAASPTPEILEITNATATLARIRGAVDPNGSETRWRFQYIDKATLEREQANKQEELWTTAQEGVISQEEAEAVASEVGKPDVSTVLTGLESNTVYLVRLAATGELGWGGPGEAVSQARSFETEGAPDVLTFQSHALHDERVRVLGAIRTNAAVTNEEQVVSIGGGATGGAFTLTVNGVTTQPIQFIPHETEDHLTELDRINRALDEALGGEVALVRGTRGGPYTVLFYGSLAGKNLPQMTAESQLTPSGTVTVTTSQEGGEGYDTHYYAEYVSAKSFAESGWSKAAKTEETDLGFGVGGEPTVGIDLPALDVGETYRYRLAATNTSPGNPVTHGPEQVLSAAPAAEAGAEECPNAGSRTGASIALPDCRAYEQVTPVDKEGTMDPFHYGLQLQNEGVIVAPDGQKLVYNGLYTQWGSAGQSPYLFSHEEERGWQMLVGTPQPEASVYEYTPELFSADLKSMAFKATWHAGLLGSPRAEFKAGPLGGPYTTLASVPRSQLGPEGGWVAGSEDLSRLILSVEDHKLCGHSTGTSSGYDLYEYFKGECHHVNVGAGVCGARMVGNYRESDPHSISADGARVFFEAVPSGPCSGRPHLFMRVEGRKTVDVGAYGFIGANAAGTSLLLEKHGSESGLESFQFFLYDTASGTAKLIVETHRQGPVMVSEQFDALYLAVAEALTEDAPAEGGLYRYDLNTGSLRFVVPGITGHDGGMDAVTSDGRYLYFHGYVPIMSASGIDPQRIEEDEHTSGGGGYVARDLHSEQAFRYDSMEDVVECISCASSFDSEPRYDAFFGQGNIAGARSQTKNDIPGETVASADGDFAFFDTVAALVPQDLNGEVTPEWRVKSTFFSPQYSPSSDVYEWRRNGVDGCDRIQGCLSLISSGQAGKLVMLLGASRSGSDVFFSTAAPLSALDNDAASDIYDARIGGHAAVPPPGPSECEGATCSTPVAPPSDLVPSSLTFEGRGNVLSPSNTQEPAKHKRHRTRRKHGKRSHRKRRAAGHAHPRHKAGRK